MVVVAFQLSLALLVISFLLKWALFVLIKSKASGSFFWHDRVELRHTDSVKDKQMKGRSNKMSILILFFAISSSVLFYLKHFIHLH